MEQMFIVVLLLVISVNCVLFDFVQNELSGWHQTKWRRDGDKGGEERERERDKRFVVREEGERHTHTHTYTPLIHTHTLHTHIERGGEKLLKRVFAPASLSIAQFLQEAAAQDLHHRHR